MSGFRSDPPTRPPPVGAGVAFRSFHRPPHHENVSVGNVQYTFFIRRLLAMSHFLFFSSSKVFVKLRWHPLDWWPDETSPVAQLPPTLKDRCRSRIMPNDGMTNSHPPPSAECQECVDPCTFHFPLTDGRRRKIERRAAQSAAARNIFLNRFQSKTL